MGLDSRRQALWLCMLLAGSSSWLACSHQGELASELRRLTQENLDAIAPGDVEVWRRNAHDALVHVDEEGTARSKGEFLAALKPLPPGLVGQIAVDEFHVASHGDTAVATHVDREELDYFGQKLESRWRTTDTWIRTGAGWRLVAEQVLALQVDPPSITLPAQQLCAYNGTYALTDDIRATITCKDDGLSVMRSGRPELRYKPEAVDVFFAPGQPRTRRIFLRDAQGNVTGFVDRREGHDIRWRKTAPAAAQGS